MVWIDNSPVIKKDKKLSDFGYKDVLKEKDILAKSEMRFEDTCNLSEEQVLAIKEEYYLEVFKDISKCKPSWIICLDRIKVV